MTEAGRGIPEEVAAKKGHVLPDLEKILAADRQGQRKVTRALQEALVLKSQADAQVWEEQAQLQAELAQVRQSAQTEILPEGRGRLGSKIWLKLCLGVI